MSLTLTSPLTPLAPLVLAMVTLVVNRLLLKAAPVISPPLAAMVKSVGSINHVPVVPFAALVVIFVLLVVLT